MVFVVVVFLFIHIAFYVLIFSRLVFYKVPSKPLKESRHSIVICYRNEEENIKAFLPSILNQKFSDLVLVDDNSEDKTNDILQKMGSTVANIISIEKESSGKKEALSRGIKEAKEDRILLTDADCRPSSSNWSSHMSNQDTPFVLGYGPMNKKKGIVALFARYETYMTALQYLSYAIGGMPYMGVGRNLMINKSLVLKNKTKIKGQHLASGDDDLMINAIANNNNTSICIHPESFMYSDSKTSLSGFLTQKTRHVSTSTYYKPLHKFLLGLFSISQIIFFLGLILGFIMGIISLKITLMFLLMKWGMQQSVNFHVMKKLKEDDLFWKVPFLDVLYFFYFLIMPFYYLINKNNSRWS